MRKARGRFLPVRGRFLSEAGSCGPRPRAAPRWARRVGQRARKSVRKGKANFVARARSASRPGNAPHSSLPLGRRPWRSKSLGMHAASPLSWTHAPCKMCAHARPCFAFPGLRTYLPWNLVPADIQYTLTSWPSRSTGITRCICCGTPSAWPALVSGRGVSCVGWYPRPPRPRRRRRMHPPGVSQEPCVTGPAAHPCPRQPWLRCSISAIGEVRSVEMTAQCSLVPLPSSCCPSAPRPRRSSLRPTRSRADCCHVTAAACSAAPRKPGSFWPSAPAPCVSGPGRSARRPTRPRRRRAPPCTRACRHARRRSSRAVVRSRRVHAARVASAWRGFARGSILRREPVPVGAGPLVRLVTPL